MSETREAPKVFIRKVPVLPFKMSVLCECGGEFVFDDSPVALHPRAYRHKCNKCGYELQLLECFPKTVYEEIPNDPESN